jgi:hypothetical protein
MSALGTILAFIFALLGYIFSFKGVFTLLAGFLVFLMLPVIPKATGEFKRLANLHLWLATSMLGRVGVVISEHSDLLLKSMSFDDLGVETISFGSETKEFEDPDSALHYWMGLPFALVSEAEGVLFDPRHAALGTRKNEHDERGETTVPATQSEWETYGVHSWKRGVWEMSRAYELVDLSRVRHLVDGGERSEYPKRVESIYQNSRAPFKTGTGATRFIMIIVALLAPFAALWLLATQGDNVGGGGTTVGYGSSVLLFIAGAKDLRELLGEIDKKRAATHLGVMMPLPLLFLLIAFFISPLVAILAFLTLGFGFLIPVVCTVLVRPSAKLSEGYARMLMKLGFTGYNKPVFEWTPEKYVLREFDELEETGVDRVKWYGLCGSLVGFTFTPDESSWGADVVDKDELESKTEAIADGGQVIESNLPGDCTRVPDMARASAYAGFVPKNLKSSKYYVDTGIASARFSDSAVGEKALRRLLWAKEEYGESDGLSDRTIIHAMIGCGIVSFSLGVFVFFL